MYSNRIILVSRDKDITLMCRKAFAKENIRIQTIPDYYDALDIRTEGFSGAVILDSTIDEDNLPGLCEFISDSLKIPVIVISRKEVSTKKVEYLDSGADICIEVPINADELLAQVKALRRRTDAGELHPDKAEFASGDLRIDYHRRLVTVKGEEVRLSHREYELLRELTVNAGKTLSYNHLLRKVWGPEYQGERNYLHVNINHLRKKIEPDPRKPKHIINVPRVGYVFKHT
ncbi:MAG: response regulator transcription factor [Dehalococcoidales bacterium]|nr:response regulator transcription factor [Dehalococcoidales bacterium]